MSASVTRSITDSVNTALRKISASIDGVKAVAVDAKQTSDTANRTASATTHELANALAQLKVLEQRIVALEQQKTAPQ